MKVVVTNPSIAPHIRQSLLAYNEAGYLLKFYTSFVHYPGSKLPLFLKVFKPLRSILSRRSLEGIPSDKIIMRPLPELLRSISARIFSPQITDAIWEWSELGFDRWAAAKIKHSDDVIHTYEHAALSTLIKSRRLNLFSVYEQPSQYHSFFSEIAKHQMKLYPELDGSATGLLVNEKAKRRNRRRDQELTLASLILCNSTFTKNTLVASGIPSSKIRIIPLAFPEVIDSDKPARMNSPVTFLYAGNQSLRKGSHLLYEAWKLCEFKEEEAKLLLVGKMLLPAHLRSDLPGKVVIRGNIPHEEMMEVYRQADIFVLPTLADGFGMVVTEAMSQGVPVIASVNSCGPDVIDHTQDGWLIPAGDLSALVAQMKWCVKNRNQLNNFSKSARQKALSWQWPQYRQLLTETIYGEWQKFKNKDLSV